MKRIFTLILLAVSLCVPASGQILNTYEHHLLYGDFGFVTDATVFPPITTMGIVFGTPIEQPTPLHQGLSLIGQLPDNPPFLYPFSTYTRATTFWPPQPTASAFDDYVDFLQFHSNDQQFNTAGRFRFNIWFSEEIMALMYGVENPMWYHPQGGYINPGWPIYFEPDRYGGGVIFNNYGPVLLIEYHIGHESLVPIPRETGWQFVDPTRQPYKIVQELIPWRRMLYAREQYEASSIPHTWHTFTSKVLEGAPFDPKAGWGTFPAIGPTEIAFSDLFPQNNPNLQKGDHMICQAKVHMIMPYANAGYNPYGYSYPFDNFYVVSFWTNKIDLEVR